MAKQRGKQEQQHRGQRSSRQRSSKGDTTGSGDQYKPSFPVNIFTNSKALYAVGGFLVIGGLLAAILMSSLQSNSPGRSAPDPLRESAVAETENIEPYRIVKKNKIFLIKNSQKFQSNNLI